MLASVAHGWSDTGKKPFICDVCYRGWCKPVSTQERSLTNVTPALVDHSHTGEKPFICDACYRGWCKPVPTHGRSLKNVTPDTVQLHS
jgi:hypothetical protein